MHNESQKQRVPGSVVDDIGLALSWPLPQVKCRQTFSEPHVHPSHSHRSWSQQAGLNLVLARPDYPSSSVHIFHLSTDGR